MGLWLIFIPVLVAFGILWLCKRYNFSILPEDLRSKRKPVPFTIPNLRRKATENPHRYKWDVSESSDEDSDEE